MPRHAPGGLCGRLRLPALLTALVSAIACGSDTLQIPVPICADQHCSVAVIPTGATLPKGDTITFTAVMTPQPDTSARYYWTSSDSTKVTVDQSGFATMLAQTTSVSVCAALTRDPSKFTCARVTVL